MNHIGSNLVEELDPRVFPYLSCLRRISTGRDPYTPALDRRVHHAHLGLIADGGCQIRPGRFRADLASFVPELSLCHLWTPKSLWFWRIYPCLPAESIRPECGKPNNSVDCLI